MNKENNPFDNLLKIGQLKQEAFIKAEFDGLVSTANRKLHDAKNVSLSKDSRFDLAYNAAHSLSLAALRKAGYRSENRYTVFQLLESTAGLPASTWRIFATALAAHCPRPNKHIGNTLAARVWG
ncbi:hypothetical protein [Limnobacter sp.]|uniref:hypothetical protein n=1 Tax=Limnobacter sp. TaxID=2003368 RepID=UPI002FE19D22